MITCVNKECHNYNQELEDSAELCPSCGMKTETAVSKSNSKLTVAACFGALAAFAIFWAFNLYVGIGLVVASIVVGFISRSKAAVIIPVLSLAAMIAFMITWFG